MRIAIAAHSARRAGGAEQYLATLVPALRRSGHEVACWFEIEGADQALILDHADAVESWRAADDPRAALDALRAWRPDVLYTHGIADVAHERTLLEVAPAVLFAHSYYGTCISGTKTVQVPASRCCTRTFGPSCLLQYYPRRCGGWSPMTMLRRYGVQQARLDMLGAYARIVVASRHMEAEYARHGFASKTSVAGLPIEARMPVVGARAPDAHERRLLYLGRLEASKGADVALESAARAAQALSRPVHLQISGAGTLHAWLAGRSIELMHSQPLLRVTFTGWLDEPEVAWALDRSDLLLVPSRWPEPFGMVGVEAALRGVPSVAFGVGGIPEWLTDGVTGRLVAEGPAATDRFAAAVVETLRYPAALARMRGEARQAVARFTTAAHLSTLEPILAAAAAVRTEAVLA